MKRYIFLLILLCFFFIPKAYAVQTNYDSYFNINYTDKVDFSRVVYPNGDTLKDYLDYATSIDNNNYFIITSLDFRPNNTILSYNGNNDIPDNVLESWYYSDSEVVANVRFYVWLVPKSVNSVVKVKLSITTSGGAYQNINFSNISSSYPVYRISTFGNSNNNYEFLDILDDCLAGNCSNYVANDGVTTFSSSTSNNAINVYSQYFPDYNTYNQNITYTNSGDANLYAYSFIYSSQVDLIYNSASNTGSSTLRKSIYYPQVDTSITVDDKFLTYTDVVPTDSEYIKNNSSYLDNFYLKIPIEHYSDFVFNSTFKTNIDTSTFNYNSYGTPFVFGRIDNGTYYSYADITGYCSVSVDTTTIQNHILQFSISDLVCDNNVDFTDYDYIYVTYIHRYRDSSIDMGVTDFTGSVNYGYFSAYSGKGGYIYEFFDNLSNNFTLSLSGSNYIGYADIYSSDTTNSVFITCYTSSGSISTCNNFGLANNSGTLIKPDFKNGYTYTIYQVSDTYIPVSLKIIRSILI